MLQHPAAVRAGFEEAADTFLATVRSVPDALWDAPGALGEWTLRELVAHTLRAFSTIETYLASDSTDDRVVADAVGYYRAVLAGGPELHRSVAQRGRQAGIQLTDPPGQSEDIVQRVLALVASVGDDDPIVTPAGTMVFSEYLVTRTLELGVHALDIQRATNQTTSMGPDTAAVVLGVLVPLADAPRLVLALTGRQQLPADYNLLA
jgi:uncharacterized protein (TIGR03083 family)